LHAAFFDGTAKDTESLEAPSTTRHNGGRIVAGSGRTWSATASRARSMAIKLLLSSP